MSDPSTKITWDYSLKLNPNTPTGDRNRTIMVKCGICHKVAIVVDANWSLINLKGYALNVSQGPCLPGASHCFTPMDK